MAEKVLSDMGCRKESFVKWYRKRNYREVSIKAVYQSSKSSQIYGSDQHHADAVLAQPRNVHVLKLSEYLLRYHRGVESFIVPDQSEQEYEIRDERIPSKNTGNFPVGDKKFRKPDFLKEVSLPHELRTTNSTSPPCRQCTPTDAGSGCFCPRKEKRRRPGR